MVPTSPDNRGSTVFINRDNVRIERIVLDLHDIIVDSKKAVLFEYE